MTTDIKKCFKVVFGCGQNWIVDDGQIKKRKYYAIHAFNTCGHGHNN